MDPRSLNPVSASADYRFLWRPWWLLSHVFVVTLIVVFVSLGFWQLRRLDDRRTYNALVESRTELPVSSVAELAPGGPSTPADGIDDVAFRFVTLTGTYLPDQEVLVRNRTLEGLPGFWMITPLLLSDGTAVAVNRGWVPFAGTSPDAPWPEFAPPAGLVTVDGMVRESQARSTGLVGGPVDAVEGRLSTLSRVDVPRLDQQVSEALYPFYVDLRAQQPAQAGDLPVPVPEPELGEGPHLNYAGQWFIFAALTTVVYPLLLRRVARNRATERTVGRGVGDDSTTIELREPEGADR